MSRHDPHIRLKHIRDFARKAIVFTEGKTRQQLEEDEVLSLALIRLVEMIGEAASQLPDDIKQQYPGVPWPKVISMRHRLIHGYDAVDLDILWNTINTNIPALLKELDLTSL